MKFCAFSVKFRSKLEYKISTQVRFDTSSCDAQSTCDVTRERLLFVSRETKTSEKYRVTLGSLRKIKQQQEATRRSSISPSIVVFGI